MQDAVIKKKSGCSCGSIIVVLLILGVLILGLMGFAGYKLYNSSIEILETSTVSESSLVDAWKQTETDLANGLGKEGIEKISDYFAVKNEIEPLILTPTELQLILGEMLQVQLKDKAKGVRFLFSSEKDNLTAKVSLPIGILSEFGIGEGLLSESLRKKFFECTVSMLARVRNDQPYLAVDTIKIDANPELAAKLSEAFAGDNLVSMSQNETIRSFLALIKSLEIEHGAVRIEKK
jgi:hypothetical protein